VVEEAQSAGTYVSAHIYTDDAIRRWCRGRRSFAGALQLIKADTAKLAAKNGCFAVAYLVTYDKLASEGGSLGFPPDSIAKVEVVRARRHGIPRIMKKAGLPMAYGSDLLGEMHRHQSEEFVIRGRVLPRP